MRAILLPAAPIADAARCVEQLTKRGQCHGERSRRVLLYLADHAGTAQAPEQLVHFLAHHADLSRAPLAAPSDDQDITDALDLLGAQPPFGAPRGFGAADHRLANVQRAPGSVARFVEGLPQPVARPHA